MSKKHVILPRQCSEWRHEQDIAAKHFPVISYRSAVEAGQIVIGRFSAIPFYREQEKEYQYLGAEMINSYNEHLFVANIKEWYSILHSYTAKTYDQLHLIPETGPFVLKGTTNSKKFLWDTHMFARDKKEAIEVHSKLSHDGLLEDQEIVIREYIPLITYTQGLRGLPITREFRFFCYQCTILSGGYYWSSHVDEVVEKGCSIDPAIVPKDWLQKVVNYAGLYTNFYSLDVAQAENGQWIVIELNDGQMSGLSENDADTMYSNLSRVL